MVKHILDKDTLIPISLVCAIVFGAVSLTWQLAADRERAWSQINLNAASVKQNAREIEKLKNIQDTLNEIKKAVGEARGE